MKLKKAQRKMFETISILFIFFILLTMGFIFYAKVKRSSIGQENEKAIILKAIQISEKASFLSDIQCSADNNPIDDCIDVQKLEALSTIVEGNLLYYYNVFENSNITVTEIYPNPGKQWQIYNNPKPGSTDITKIQLPISIYYPTTDDFAFGYIDVSVYR